MSPTIRVHPLLLVAGVLALTATPASAGWVCIKNETKSPVVVVEVPPLPILKRGKVVKLQPGEVYREYHPFAGEKKVHIFDTCCPARLLFCGTMKWTTEKVALRIEPDGDAVALVPVRPGKGEVVVEVGPPKP